MPIVRVDGQGDPSFTFAATGLYTFYVASRRVEHTGWYSFSLECQSWGFTPCDTVPHSSNYGEGFAGTNGVVPALTAITPPVIGTTCQLHVGNSYGQPTPAIVLLGACRGSASTPFGGTLLVSSPTVLPPFVPLPAAGGSIGLPIPALQLLQGLSVSLQSVVADPGAMHAAGLSFSRGLLLIFG
jgi:hypothetical protein